MTTPKSPDTVMEEFLINFPATNDSDSKELSMYQRKVMKNFLRSSMASLLCYMAERMPNLDEPKGMLAKVAPNNHQQIIGYNAGLDECRTLLIEEARRISEV